MSYAPGTTVLLRKALSVPMASCVSPVFLLSSFKISDLISKSLIHLDLIFVQDEPRGSDFKAAVFLALFRMRQPQLGGFASVCGAFGSQGSFSAKTVLVFFPWLCYNWRFGTIMLPALLFLLGVTAAILDPLCSHRDLRVVFF